MGKIVETISTELTVPLPSSNPAHAENTYSASRSSELELDCSLCERCGVAVLKAALGPARWSLRPTFEYQSEGRWNLVPTQMATEEIRSGDENCGSKHGGVDREKDE